MEGRINVYTHMVLAGPLLSSFVRGMF